MPLNINQPDGTNAPLIYAAFSAKRSDDGQLDRQLARRLERHGLSTAFWYYLRILWLEEGFTQRELSGLTFSAENTTTSIVNNMMKAGLLERRSHFNDRRKKLIFLSQKGRELKAETYSYIREVNEVALKDMSAAERELLIKLLNKACDNLEQAWAA